jgi:hypothetical protein
MRVNILYSYTAEAQPAAIDWNKREFDSFPAPSLEFIPLLGDSVEFGADAPRFDVIHRTFTWLAQDHLRVELLLDVPAQQKKSAADT